VDNTINGGFFSWAAGGTLAPIRDIQFRGNYTRSFRSPAITELFFPQSPGFNFVNDLCTPAARNSGPAPAIRLRNCNAFLAAFPNATPLDAAQASVPSLSGGNPNLQNEVAESWSAGVIIRPRWIPRLSITADWIDIRIQDPIANLTTAQVVSACFDNPDFNLNDPANGNDFCSAIRRNPAGTRDPNGRDIGGQVPNDPANPAVRVGFVNGERIEFEGLQGTLNYTLPLDFLGLQGNFDVGADVLYVERRLVDLTGVAPTESQGLQVNNDPQFGANIRFRYTERQWGITSSIQFTGNQTIGFTNRDDRDVREIDEIDAYAIVNAGLFFNVSENFRFNFSVTNLFNEQGQDYFGVLIPASQVDLLGRRYAASVRLSF
jgi:outer membrane receptor protein involved in Fe transport